MLDRWQTGRLLIWEARTSSVILGSNAMLMTPFQMGSTGNCSQCDAANYSSGIFPSILQKPAYSFSEYPLTCWSTKTIFDLTGCGAEVSFCCRIIHLSSETIILRRRPLSLHLVTSQLAEILSNAGKKHCKRVEYSRNISYLSTFDEL